MAPTICTEKESRVRRIRRRSSSSSVISYVGKITHRRSVTMRNASSKLASSRIWDKISTCESNNNEESIQSPAELKGSKCSEMYDNSNNSRSFSESSTNCDCSDRLSSKTPDSGYRTSLGSDRQLFDKTEISSLQDVLTLNEDSSSSCSMHCSKAFAKVNTSRKRKNSKGLLEIAIKTIKLIRRNQLLQQKLAQLQFETRAFIESVMANPENRALRDKMEKSTNPE